MVHRTLWIVLSGLLACGSALPLPAQRRVPADGGATASLGQPVHWQWTLGAATGVRTQPGDEAAVTEGRVGVYRELLNRSLGLGGLQVEGYSGSRDTRPRNGVRVAFFSPFLRLGVGADYDFGDRQLHHLYTLVHPVRRGGIFHDGSMLRLDFEPGSGRAFMVGIEKPVFRRIPLGTTRPKADVVAMRDRRPPAVTLPADSQAIRAALATAREAALSVQRLCVPWLDHRAVTRSDAMVVARLNTIKRSMAGSSDAGSGIPIERETRRLHASVEQAFSLAIDTSGGARAVATEAGRRVAQRAREILLDEVLIPYDRLLGQEKEEDTTREFAVLARGIFARWVVVESGLSPAAGEAAQAVFSEVLSIVEAARAAARRDWGASRYVWLPLQLAIRPEEHDTQDELDALVARATREPFTDGNAVSYVINEQFQYQLSRTIRAARDYHVLWVHDVRGVDDRGDPDEMTYRHVLRSYLAAMIARVRAYDSTGRFPVYMIILDEWFYEVNKTRLWFDLLEDPTRRRVHLPARFSAWEDSLGAAQDSLRAAIARSSLLTAQRRQYGEGWLRNLVKVHVSITNASDPSFWSWRVAQWFPFPDNWMRDHRKLVFYDISEDDLYRGEALFTGSGVGEHYASTAWEDRSLLVRGPVTVALKSAARALMLKQGIPAERIPPALAPRPRALDYDAQVARAAADNPRPLRAVMLQNNTGFDEKSINIAKAVLYTLMPAGSVIKVPDSLWNSTFWGSALLGCSLRGVRVLVIAPALANAPARAFGSMIRNREMLWRLASASQVLAPEIAASGGLLKVGVYASEFSVTDIPGKVRSVRRTLQQHAWLRELFDYPASVYPGLDSLAAALDSLPSLPDTVPDFEAHGAPRLHLKANFFASREAWSALGLYEWVPMTRDFVQRRMSQVERRSTAVSSFQEYPDALIDVGGEVMQRWYDSRTPEQRARVVFYTMLGSHNQNDRSFVSDGEDAIILSHWPAVIPYLDLISIIGQSRWIDDPKELDAFLPQHSDVVVRLAHWFKVIF
ncbi:MAG: hypothetical protein IPF47_17670 [Gemmatimonadetes bacterium]|nr:hypothetical protein [Gemmatimonadota bacterium]MBK6845671.1 hypothetical protein [Gemmatimonadota bacterium]